MNNLLGAACAAACALAFAGQASAAVTFEAAAAALEPWSFILAGAEGAGGPESAPVIYQGYDDTVSRRDISLSYSYSDGVNDASFGAASIENSGSLLMHFADAERGVLSSQIDNVATVDQALGFAQVGSYTWMNYVFSVDTTSLITIDYSNGARYLVLNLNSPSDKVEGHFGGGTGSFSRILTAGGLYAVQFQDYDAGKLTRDTVGSSSQSSTTSYAFEITSYVPEPSTWAMMIGGMGAAGAMLRRRRAFAS